MTTLNLSIELHPKQYDVFEDDSRFIVLVAGRRFGKTTLAVQKLLVNALDHPSSLNWYIAPTYTQAKMIAWRMLLQAVPVALIAKKNETELALTLQNGSRIELKGCDNPDSLRGVGVKYVVVDEFAIIPDAMDLWGAVLRPLLTDTKGRALFIGTPKGLNTFHDLYQKGIRGDDEFKSFLFTSYENPYIDPQEIEKAKSDTLPSIFAQEYLCSFVASDENVLIKLEAIEGLKGINRYWADIKRIISCDPALGGDECVIYVIENTKIREMKVLHYDDAMKIAGELMMLGAKHYCKDFILDGCLLGKAIESRLSELKQKVTVVPGAQHCEPEERAYNLRAKMWWYLMQKIQNQEIEYFTDNELKRQLSSVRFKVSDSSGKIMLEKKEETKKRLGCSPDRADAFVYGQYGLQFVKAQDYTPFRYDFKREEANKIEPLYNDMMAVMANETPKSDYEF